MKLPKARQLPSGNWFVQLRVGGQSISITEPTEEKCQARALAIKTGIIEQQKIDATSTLTQMIDAYINERSNTLSPTTIKGYRAIQRGRFLPYMNKKASLVNWQSAINAEAKLCSPRTLKNAWGLVGTVLKRYNLKQDVFLPQVPPPDTEWLDPQQIHCFIDLIKGQSFEIPALLGLCSLRRSEIFGLEWKNVDLSKNQITIKGAVVVAEKGLVQKQTNKTSKSTRTIPILIPQLKEALEAVEEKTGFVVKGHPNSLYKQIVRICRANGLPEVGVHGLRRSFSSLCYHLGIPELVTMNWGGWDDYQTVHKHYLKLAQQDSDNGQASMIDFYLQKHLISNANANEISEPLINKGF